MIMTHLLKLALLFALGHSCLEGCERTLASRLGQPWAEHTHQLNLSRDMSTVLCICTYICTCGVFHRLVLAPAV